MKSFKTRNKIKKDMKKIVLTGIMVMMALAGKLQAQDCEYIVGCKYGHNAAAMSLLSPAKLDYYCRLSRNSMYVTNEVPSGARVIAISELKNVRTKEHLPMDFVVNMDSMSFYAYNFNDFQAMERNETVYFSTPNSEYPYLALRSYKDMMILTGEPNMELDVRAEER